MVIINSKALVKIFRITTIEGINPNSIIKNNKPIQNITKSRLTLGRRLNQVLLNIQTLPKITPKVKTCPPICFADGGSLIKFLILFVPLNRKILEAIQTRCFIFRKFNIPIYIMKKLKICY